MRTTDELKGRVAENLLPLGDSISAARLPRRKGRVSRKSAVLLRVLRQKARGTRNKKPRTFYSIRAAANHFGVPPTTISRIYTQLKSEGLLTSVWGSKTFVPPARIDNQLRVRAVVALPASLSSFCTVWQYRNFFLEMRDALWKFGFATRLLFFEGSEAESPSFAALILDYKPDIVIWLQPPPKMKGTIARLLDRAIRVITVDDCPPEYDEQPYRIDRTRAIKEALFDWRQNGIRSVTVLQNPRGGSSRPVALLLEKCLRDAAMPRAFGNAEPLEFQNTILTYAQRPDCGIIFTSSELAVAVAVRNPAAFAKLAQQLHIILMDGPIDMPGFCDTRLLTDFMDVDVRSIAKRIVKDLVQSSPSRRIEPIIFHAKWVPRLANKPVDARFRSRLGTTLMHIQSGRNAAV